MPLTRTLRNAVPPMLLLGLLTGCPDPSSELDGGSELTDGGLQSRDSGTGGDAGGGDAGDEDGGATDGGALTDGGTVWAPPRTSEGCWTIDELSSALAQDVAFDVAADGSVASLHLQMEDDGTCSIALVRSVAGGYERASLPELRADCVLDLSTAVSLDPTGGVHALVEARPATAAQYSEYELWYVRWAEGGPRAEVIPQSILEQHVSAADLVALSPTDVRIVLGTFDYSESADADRVVSLRGPGPTWTRKVLTSTRSMWTYGGVRVARRPSGAVAALWALNTLELMPDIDGAASAIESIDAQVGVATASSGALAAAPDGALWVAAGAFKDTFFADQLLVTKRDGPASWTSELLTGASSGATGAAVAIGPDGTPFVAVAPEAPDVMTKNAGQWERRGPGTGVAQSVQLRTSSDAVHLIWLQYGALRYGVCPL